MPELIDMAFKNEYVNTLNMFKGLSLTDEEYK